ncbi:MAG: DUF4860 domain-containing protein [Eubacteriales bacterium]|nr:DUF4860 domain-containing protein [Eubacteriales bacterium]
MKQSRKDPSLLLSVGVLSLFLVGFLLLVIFGARSYRDVVDGQYDNMDGRALSAYLAASVKANDSLGAATVEDSEYGPVLVIADAATGYALRYYRYDGQLVEDLARSGAPLAPKEAQPIAPTGVFSAEFPQPGLLCVTTDAGRTLVCLRSGEEAAP